MKADVVRCSGRSVANDADILQSGQKRFDLNQERSVPLMFIEDSRQADFYEVGSRTKVLRFYVPYNIPRSSRCWWDGRTAGQRWSGRNRFYRFFWLRNDKKKKAIDLLARKEFEKFKFVSGEEERRA